MKLWVFLEFCKSNGSWRKVASGISRYKSIYFHRFPICEFEVIDPIFSDLVQKLCVIQDKTGHFVRISNEGIAKRRERNP